MSTIPERDLEAVRTWKTLYFSKKDTTQTFIDRTKQLIHYQLRVLSLPPVLYPDILPPSVNLTDNLPFKMHKHLRHVFDGHYARRAVGKSNGV